MIDLSFLSIPVILVVITYNAMWVIYSFASLLPRPIRNPRYPTPPPLFNPRVTILIPARNEEEVIVKQVREAIAQTYSNIELIVVAHNCTDRTYELAKQEVERMGLKHAKVIDYKTDEAGKALALNKGVEESTGDIICVLDAGSKMEYDYIEKAVKHFERGCAALQGKIVGENPEFNFLTKMQDVEFRVFFNIFCKGRYNLGMSAGIGGTGVMIHRKVLEEVGGWRNVLIEDYDIFLRISEKYRVVYAPECVVYDEKVVTWSSLIRQRSRWLKGHLDLILEKPLVRNPFDLLYLYNISFIIALWISLFLGSSLIITALVFGKPVIFFHAMPFKAFAALSSFYPVTFYIGMREDYPPSESMNYVLKYALPFYFFSFHWYIAFIESFGVKSWAHTKTKHYGYDVMTRE